MEDISILDMVCFNENHGRSMVASTPPTLTTQIDTFTSNAPKNNANFGMFLEQDDTVFRAPLTKLNSHELSAASKLDLRT